MDPKSLRLFLALAEELHYGKAAKRLFISQPPLTKHIQQLEEKLGVTLFDRNKRSVRLTPAGLVLVDEARRMLAQSEQSIRAVQRAERGDIGRARIGFVAAILFMGIEQALQRIEQEMPEVETLWEEMGSSEQLEALIHDRIDLGFGQVSQGINELRSYVVDRVPLAIALPRAHPLAQHKTVELSRLAGDTFIAIPRQSAPRFHDLTLATCLAAGFSPNIGHYAKHLVSIVSLVAMGRGVALVPQSFARANLPGVILKPTKGMQAQAEYSVIWNPNSKLKILPRILELIGVPRTEL